MLDFVLTVIRYIFLALLYIFIFQLIKMMFRDMGARENTILPARALSGGTPDDVPSPAEAIPPPGAEAGLVVVSSGDPGLPKGSVFPLRHDAGVSLGRGSRNSITLVDPFASMEHATVSGSGGQYWLTDRGSRNGTYLNEVRISNPTVLADGDRIRIGGVTLQYVRWAYEVESGNGNGTGQETKRG